MALRMRRRIIVLFDSRWRRIPEGGRGGSAGYGEVFKAQRRGLGPWIPQISVIMGPCAGRRSLSPAMTDIHIHGARDQLISSPGRMW